MPKASAEARSADGRGGGGGGGGAGGGLPLLPGGVRGVSPRKCLNYMWSFVAPGGYLAHDLL